MGYLSVLTCSVLWQNSLSLLHTWPPSRRQVEMPLVQGARQPHTGCREAPRNVGQGAGYLSRCLLRSFSQFRAFVQEHIRPEWIGRDNLFCVICVCVFVYVSRCLRPSLRSHRSQQWNVRAHVQRLNGRLPLLGVQLPNLALGQRGSLPRDVALPEKGRSFSQGIAFDTASPCSESQSITKNCTRWRQECFSAQECSEALCSMEEGQQ